MRAPWQPCGSTGWTLGIELPGLPGADSRAAPRGGRDRGTPPSAAAAAGGSGGLAVDVDELARDPRVLWGRNAGVVETEASSPGRSPTPSASSSSTASEVRVSAANPAKIEPALGANRPPPSPGTSISPEHPPGLMPERSRRLDVWLERPAARGRPPTRPRVAAPGGRLARTAARSAAPDGRAWRRPRSAAVRRSRRFPGRARLAGVAAAREHRAALERGRLDAILGTAAVRLAARPRAGRALARARPRHGPAARRPRGGRRRLDRGGGGAAVAAARGTARRAGGRCGGRSTGSMSAATARRTK